jgi:hypothetical protein
MALRLETNYKGITCDYWRIDKVEYSYRSSLTGSESFVRAIVTLAIYVNMATRVVDVKNIVFTKIYIFPHIVKTGVSPDVVVTEYMPNKDTREKVYKELKKLSEFAGAVDI